MRILSNCQSGGRIDRRQDPKDFCDSDANPAQTSQDIDKKEIVVTKPDSQAKTKTVAKCNAIGNAGVNFIGITQADPQENLGYSDAGRIGNAGTESIGIAQATPHESFAYSDTGGIGNAGSKEKAQAFADVFTFRNANTLAESDSHSGIKRNADANSHAEEEGRARVH